MSEYNPMHNPWVGLASYDDPKNVKYEPKFCGRDDESYDVAKLIRNNIFVTLYGKSGIGKTSLINAGVIPDLRDECYMPLSIRLGLNNNDNSTKYQTVIVRSIEDTANNAGVTIKTFDVVPEQPNFDAPDYLWNYFARHHFVDQNGNDTFPVIVFDQFEEVLRAHRDKSEVLLRQLHYLSDKDHRIDSCKIGGEEYRYDSNFRFVVSIREDDLYRLEDCIDNCYLASLKRCRYRLRSLTEHGARDVILIPGEGLFDENEQDQIAESIINIARNKEDGSINTYLLSLVCYRIFIEHTHRNEKYIKQSLVDAFVKGNPFEQFYDEATKALSSHEKAYIEDHFVDSMGRRNSIPESDFHKHVPRGDSLIDGDKRILQRISSSSGNNVNRIELLHDSFCDHLFERKQKRQQRQKLLRFLEIIGMLVIIGLISFLFFEITDKGKEIVDAKQKLETAKQELKDVNTKKADIEKEAEKAEKERRRAEQQLDSLKQQLSSLEIEIAIVKKGMNDEKNKNIKTTQQLLELQKKFELEVTQKSTNYSSNSHSSQNVGTINPSQKIAEMSDEERKTLLEELEKDKNP